MPYVTVAANKPPGRMNLHRSVIGQDATGHRFWKMHQRGGSPQAVERRRLKGELAEVGADQRQRMVSTSSG